MGEITVILVLALIFIGPKKLPELASGLGRLIREIRKTTADVKNELQLDEAIRRPFQELRDAVTLPPEELKRRDRIRRDLEDIERRAAADAAQALVESESGAGQSEHALGADPGGATAEHDSQLGLEGSGSLALPSDSNAALALAAVPTGDASVPVPGTPPLGTVARPAPGRLPPPPLFPALPGSPPLGSPPLGSIDRRASASASSELLRALRSDRNRKPTSPGLGAADQSNTTQILSDSDLATLAATAPPPPPTFLPRQTPRGAAPEPSPVPLPGSTPPKTPPSST
jgi:sec-independent protein translocase protein TatA